MSLAVYEMRGPFECQTGICKHIQICTALRCTGAHAHTHMHTNAHTLQYVLLRSLGRRLCDFPTQCLGCSESRHSLSSLLFPPLFSDAPSVAQVFLRSHSGPQSVMGAARHRVFLLESQGGPQELRLSYFFFIFITFIGIWSACMSV